MIGQKVELINSNIYKIQIYISKTNWKSTSFLRVESHYFFLHKKERSKNEFCYNITKS